MLKIKTNQSKFLIKFKDIDPDTGEIIVDKLLAETDNKVSAIWITSSLNHQWFSQDGPNDPNREFYFIKE
jgi:hypothetical protein